MSKQDLPRTQYLCTVALLTKLPLSAAQHAIVRSALCNPAQIYLGPNLDDVIPITLTAFPDGKYELQTRYASNIVKICCRMHCFNVATALREIEALKGFNLSIQLTGLLKVLEAGQLGAI